MFPRKAVTPTLEKAFAAFWKAYPRRSPNPRAVAEVAFVGIVKEGVNPAQLEAAAAAYAVEVKTKGIGEQFVVHASTFLRQRRYLDYLPDPAAAATPAPAEPEHPLWPRLQAHMDASTFGAWIGRCEVADETHLVLTLKAPSRFVAQHIGAEFRTVLERALGKDILILGKGNG